MTVLYILLLLATVFCAVKISIWDWKKCLIPDIYLFPIFLIGLVVVRFFPWFIDMDEAIIAALIGYVLSFGIGCAFRKKSPEAIGLGDVKLLTAGGIWLGVTGLAIALVASCILGGIWGLRKKQKFIPFAPFFFVGTVLAIIAMVFFNV